MKFEDFWIKDEVAECGSYPTTSNFCTIIPLFSFLFLSGILNTFPSSVRGKTPRALWSYLRDSIFELFLTAAPRASARAEGELPLPTDGDRPRGPLRD